MTIIDARIPWLYVPYADAQYQQCRDGTYVVRCSDLGTLRYGKGDSIEAALDDCVSRFANAPGGTS